MDMYGNEDEKYDEFGNPIAPMAAPEGGFDAQIAQEQARRQALMDQVAQESAALNTQADQGMVSPTERAVSQGIAGVGGVLQDVSRGLDTAGRSIFSKNVPDNSEARKGMAQSIAGMEEGLSARDKAAQGLRAKAQALQAKGTEEERRRAEIVARLRQGQSTEKTKQAQMTQDAELAASQETGRNQRFGDTVQTADGVFRITIDPTTGKQIKTKVGDTKADTSTARQDAIDARAGRSRQAALRGEVNKITAPFREMYNSASNAEKLLADSEATGQVGNTIGTIQTLLAGGIQSGVLTNQDIARSSGQNPALATRLRDFVYSNAALEPSPENIRAIKQLIASSKANAQQKFQQEEQNYTEIAGAEGFDPKLVIRPLTGSMSSPSEKSEDSAAVEWAKANKDDPRAAEILRLNGGQ